jgi:hypothetical protein
LLFIAEILWALSNIDMGIVSNAGQTLESACEIASEERREKGTTDTSHL